jgi:predicted peptidase
MIDHGGFAPAPGVLEPRTFAVRPGRSIELESLVFVPRAARPVAGFPLLLFLHGFVESASALASIVENLDAPPAFAARDPAFPWAIVAPHCPAGRGWQSEQLVALLDSALAALPIDPNRVVVTGLSMGGYGTWDLAIRHPERFAAAVPICGGGLPQQARFHDERLMAALRRLPIRAFHGADDSVVRPSESEHVLAWLRTLGCRDVRLTIYPGIGHESWVRAYADEALWSWLRRRSR